jgi:Domain of unknown function (DUF4833)
MTETSSRKTFTSAKVAQKTNGKSESSDQKHMVSAALHFLCYCGRQRAVRSGVCATPVPGSWPRPYAWFQWVVRRTVEERRSIQQYLDRAFQIAGRLRRQRIARRSRVRPDTGCRAFPLGRDASPGRRAVLRLAVTLLLLQSPQPLFTIERSTNANVVHYDANLDGAGKLDPKAPVSVYWIMLAERGQREELSSAERRSAYGFTIVRERTSDCYTMTLAADANHPIRVCSTGNGATAETLIDGHRSFLQKMFISTRRVALILKGVNHIELFGKDAESGVLRYEKIIPE